ncbi:MAG TPA: universal stress protein [Nitrosospira sp.]|jgi:nucleotide-binding universal stress UspA family protein|nr:universal stress protein [Nitrosospira sp.]
MYKKVMVAIGDDASSPVALREASHIARTDGAQLCIVHAVTEEGDDGGSDIGSGEREGRQLLDRARNEVSAILPAEARLLKAEGEYGLNGIAAAVAGAITEWGADLLVVGTKGRRGLERLVIGSVAEKLVDTVEISILLVRSR